jgi:hypothetical protein
VALAEPLADASDTPIAVLRGTLRMYADSLPEKLALLAESKPRACAGGMHGCTRKLYDGRHGPRAGLTRNAA